MFVDAAIGLLMFVALNLLFAASWNPSFSLASFRDYGWLHSRASAVCMLAALFLATVVLLHGSGTPVFQATAFWVGVQVGVGWFTVTTYRPDDLWPFFLVLQVCLTAFPILFGMLAARGLQDARKL